MHHTLNSTCDNLGFAVRQGFAVEIVLPKDSQIMYVYLGLATHVNNSERGQY